MAFHSIVTSFVRSSISSLFSRPILPLPYVVNVYTQQKYCHWSSFICCNRFGAEEEERNFSKDMLVSFQRGTLETHTGLERCLSVINFEDLKLYAYEMMGMTGLCTYRMMPMVLPFAIRAVAGNLPWKW